MKILALDSSGLVASVAVLQDDILQAEYTINHKKTHSQTLLPMLEEIRDLIELELETVDAIAIACGPGSFTGLRIGSATAKGLGLAMNKPIIEVPTLEGLAYQLYGSSHLVCPIMDARRGQVYTGIYEFVKEETGDYMLRAVETQCATSIEKVIEKLNTLGREVSFVGDGIPVFRETIAQLLQVPYDFAPAHLNRQRAAAVGAVAEKYYQQGRMVSAAQHQPEYLRLSQAERERLEGQGK